LAVLDDALLAVSELTDNAVRHGLPPIFLSLVRPDQHLDIALYDDGNGAPVVLPASADSEGGRGLAIVTAVRESVQVTPITDDGKTVTACLLIPSNEA
jgi:anti-sigma regulatory factor (Ser/Thr protein kinase)